MEVVKRKTGISQEFLKVLIKCSTPVSRMIDFINGQHIQEIKSMEHLVDTNIRRLPNGSVDIEYYVKKCHVERSLAAHNSIRKAAGFFYTCQEYLEHNMDRMTNCCMTFTKDLVRMH